MMELLDANMMEPLNPAIIGLKHRRKSRLTYVNYTLANINRHKGNRTVYVRLQLSTTIYQQNTKFPLEIGTYCGKITTKQVYLDLAAELIEQAAKMPEGEA